MSDFSWATQMDSMSFAIVKLQTLFGETKIGDATGFLYQGLLDNKKNYWLVTNWHVLSGRSADDTDKILHSGGALPNRLQFSFILRDGQPEYASRPGEQTLVQEQFIELYDSQGKAAWKQHAARNLFDVAVLSVGDLSDRFHVFGITNLPLKMTWRFKLETKFSCWDIHWDLVTSCIRQFGREVRLRQSQSLKRRKPGIGLS